MTKKILRQGLIVTPKQLRNLADKLKQGWSETIIVNNGINELKFQINIINKTPECSDTWEIEE